MTFEQAMTVLKKMVLTGAKDLVPCEDALPGMSRSAIQRRIHGRQIPAVKRGNRWVTTARIAQAFWAESMAPQMVTRWRPTDAAGELVAEHERARWAILGA
jgi:hypothetical protein